MPTENAHPRGQADFDSRSRSPRGRGGVNAIPLGRYEPPETEALSDEGVAFF